MNYANKKIIAVITALANGYAEKELLRGIISENMKNGYATVVFSNIYNMVQKDEDIIAEQKIYDIVESDEISGIILLCESFVESGIRQKIASVLLNKNVLIIGLGTRLEEFDCLDYTLLNTSDKYDIEELTSHLIEEHNFKDIAFLTGMQEIESSRLRVEGFKSAFEKHGLVADNDKIYYGDFWLTSGEKLAERYVSGELPMPQAVICANDMMAYGMLRCFAENDVKVPEQISVVSYEYSEMRMYYSPLLTSYNRNREALGKAAAQRIYCILNDIEPPEFLSPRGNMVFGNSCPCSCDSERSLKELKNAEHRKNFNDLSLFSTMEHKLTLCRDMEEFIHIIGNFHWMIENKKNLYLCLYSDWYDTKSNKSEVMQSRSILYWGGSDSFEMDHHDIRTFFELEHDASVCYLTPVFSGQKFFGYMAMLYETPESYDEVYRHWLKSVSIGLEFLRLKNDIRYLLSCQNVSEYRDTLTGMNNEKGLKRAYQALNISDEDNLYFVMLRINLFPQQLNEEEIRKKTDSTLGASNAILKFCGNANISGRISDDSFACIVQSYADTEILSELLKSILIQEKSYIDYAGMSSFACAVFSCDKLDFDELISYGIERIEAEHRVLAEKRRIKSYSEMLRVRNIIYASPEVTFDNDSENMFTDRIDYFRRNYKKCFGITFHQDCINARIARAQYYLAASTLSISEIAEKCGYIDDKYFQRQFAACTGVPALQYRNMIHSKSKYCPL